jgi:hypothetical protein
MGSLLQFVRRMRYGPPIVVVSGLPRSGTSMMMQMLQAGGLEILTDAVRLPDASNPKGYLEFEAVKNLDKGRPPAWLGQARGKAVKIVSSLVTCLPKTYNYQVIFMRRDLDEVIASQNKMLVDRGTPPDFTQDQQVRALYATHVEDTLRFLRGRRLVSTLVVDYTQALSSPRETAQRVVKFLGTSLDVDRMAAAADPALHRNRRSAG